MHTGEKSAKKKCENCPAPQNRGRYIWSKTQQSKTIRNLWSFLAACCWCAHDVKAASTFVNHHLLLLRKTSYRIAWICYLLQSPAAAQKERASISFEFDKCTSKKINKVLLSVVDRASIAPRPVIRNCHFCEQQRCKTHGCGDWNLGRRFQSADVILFIVAAAAAQSVSSLWTRNWFFVRPESVYYAIAK